MSQDTDTLVAGEYFLAVEGYAMIRHCLTAPSVARPRVNGMGRILDRFEQFPNSLAIPLTQHAVEDGYTVWAPRYDGPNPAIDLEEPIARGMIAVPLRATRWTPPAARAVTPPLWPSSAIV